MKSKDRIMIGVLAAGAVLALGSFLVSQSKDGVANGTATDGAAFADHCIAGLVDLSARDRRWAGAKASLGQPEILSPTVPQQIRCGAILADGRSAYFTVTAVCADADDRACVTATP